MICAISPGRNWPSYKVGGVMPSEDPMLPEVLSDVAAYVLQFPCLICGAASTHVGMFFPSPEYLKACHIPAPARK